MQYIVRIRSLTEDVFSEEPYNALRVRYPHRLKRGCFRSLVAMSLAMPFQGWICGGRRRPTFEPDGSELFTLSVGCLRFLSDVEFPNYEIWPDTVVCKLCHNALNISQVIDHVFKGKKHLRNWKRLGRRCIDLNAMD